jgi:methylenetetrahydrofolate--tRNA-(uracil-5-)-methyltransferase
MEMKPKTRSPAHKSDGMAELVCSNSFRGTALSSAVGLLKEELTALGSLLLRVAQAEAVPAGRALAVDRERFSRAVERAISTHPRISVVRKAVDALPQGRVVVATGPLTDGALAEALAAHGALLSYHDAIAPLLAGEAIDREVVFAASRYEDPLQDDAYLNCPFEEKEYYQFVDSLALAEKVPLEAFESAPFFEGCLPVEEIAARGPLTLAHGPLKPVGLKNPHTGRRPFAVAQLRREDKEGSAFNLVGFQTRLVRSEQRRVFRMIPGLENAVFERYGQVHRNSFLNAPEVLDDRLRLKDDTRVTIAGQLTGVEGYVESIAAGLAAGLFIAAERRGLRCAPPPPTTATGGLLRYLTLPRQSFQPSNVVWMMIDTPPKKRGKKRQRREAAARQALDHLARWKREHAPLFAEPGG